MSVLKNARNSFGAAGLRHAGCSAHNSRNARRQAVHRIKRRETRLWRAQNQ